MPDPLPLPPNYSFGIYLYPRGWKHDNPPIWARLSVKMAAMYAMFKISLLNRAIPLGPKEGLFGIGWTSIPNQPPPPILSFGFRDGNDDVHDYDGTAFWMSYLLVIRLDQEMATDLVPWLQLQWKRDRSWNYHIHAFIWRTKRRIPQLPPTMPKYPFIDVSYFPAQTIEPLNAQQVFIAMTKLFKRVYVENTLAIVPHGWAFTFESVSIEFTTMPWIPKQGIRQ